MRIAILLTELLLGLLLTSCGGYCFRPASGWQLCRLWPSCGVPIARLTLPPDNPCDAFELEFLRSGECLTLYISLTNFAAPGWNIPVDIQTEEGLYTYHAEVLEGGQRLVLPDEAWAQLCPALLAGQCATVSLAGRSRLLSATGFATSYDQLWRRGSRLTLRHPLSHYW